MNGSGAAGSAGRRPIRVLVTDARRGSAIAFVRSLGRRGDFVVAAADSPVSGGLRSRYASARVVHPPALSRPDAAAAAIVEASHRHAVELVIPVTDEVILPLLERRNDLPAGCRVTVADDRSLAVAGDKLATVELARRLGIPVPPGEPVTAPEEAVRAASRLGYPVVVKPIRSRVLGDKGSIRRLAVRYAADPAELRRRIEDLAGNEAIVQAYEPGEGHGVEMLLRDGELIAAFQHRRLREVPVTGGASSYRESVAIDVGLREASARLLGELGWNGLAMVEYRIGPNGPRLMEINGRIWGSLPLAVACGIDFPALLADMYAGRRLPATRADYPSGVRLRNLELDLVWIAGVLTGRSPAGIRRPSRRAAFGALRDLVDPRTRDDILSLDDPGPGAVELLRLVAKLSAKVRRDDAA